MGRLRDWQMPITVGLVWAVTAYFSLALRNSSGGVLLLWLPSAVAVAALAEQPRSDWPRILFALFAANLLTSLFTNIPITASIGFGTAQVVEAWTCVSVGRRVLGHHRAPQSIRHLTGIFAAALVASAVSMVAAMPFRLQGGWEQQVWWFLAMTLGMLVGTPIIVYLRNLIRGGGLRRGPTGRGGPLALAVVFVVFGLASAAVLAANHPFLVPLLFCALVFAVVSAGQRGAAVAVFAFAVAATIGTRAGLVPQAIFGLSPFSGGLLLQGYMLLMLSMSLPLGSTLLAREMLEARLRQGNEELKSNLTILNLAKTLAGIGRWRLDCVTGKQDWSEHMLALNGLSPSLAPDPGNVRDLLPDGGEELFSQLANHRDSRIPYSFEYAVTLAGGDERILKMNAYNEFEGGRRVAIFAVAMDVTEQRKRERMLDREREVAIRRAAEARRLANTDVLTGLANRRCALARLDILLRRSLLQGSPLTVVLFDIDHFKHVNDGFGHAVGDEVLVRVAELAQRLVRSDDMVGRLGGEEFVWLLPGVNSAEGARLAERLRDAIHGQSGEGGLPPVTISLGLASRRGDEDAEAILARADAALYAAKNGGRNQVHLAA
ncbi:sensor domain-containing diguanylate cyclase [Croceibacterium aestuarii]|uniref:sensor domain-containing diguanylate cyclase n=1 Tax=Croceibacterium aestuarii TaxID=3064139 RepID=UPI00272E30ED|nr:diguanylate cyclase [Croceibacterium sp. D39]